MIDLLEAFCPKKENPHPNGMSVPVRIKHCPFHDGNSWLITMVNGVILKTLVSAAGSLGAQQWL